jgi:hypothetical protein
VTRLGVAVAGAAVVAVMGANAARAQAPDGERPGERAQQVQARFQIAAMEGVLERSVQLGARRVGVVVQSVAPEMLFVTGSPRARGFWLDGYGVFFDVDVPAMRRSLAWTFRMLDQNDRSVELALQDLKRQVVSLGDSPARQNLMQTVQVLERQVAPVPPQPDVAQPPQAADVGDSAPAQHPAPPSITAEQRAILDDPGLAYTNQVKSALVEAMIEYSAPLPIAPDQWLTVAARDQDGSRLQPGDAYDVSTIVLRIKGSDLAAYRAQQITREETRRRVEIREY